MNCFNIGYVLKKPMVYNNFSLTQELIITIIFFREEQKNSLIDESNF